MGDLVDILRTRNGYRPNLVLVVPIPRNNHDNSIGVRHRSTISDEEYNKKSMSPLGSPIDPSLTEVFIPVERRFESALINFEELRRTYPIYAELIHHKLRLSAVDCPNGWYDLLLPIVHDYAFRKTESQKVLECAVDAWHEWWGKYSRRRGGVSDHYQGLLPLIESTIRVVDRIVDTSVSRNTRT